MADLSGLIERVSAATGANLQLEVDLFVALDWEGQGDPRRAPNYTASVDAALALIERVLPDYSLSLVIDENGAKVSLGNGVKPAVRSACPTPPLALCLALLKAVQSKEGEGNG